MKVGRLPTRREIRTASGGWACVACPRQRTRGPGRRARPGLGYGGMVRSPVERLGEGGGSGPALSLPC